MSGADGRLEFAQSMGRPSEGSQLGSRRRDAVALYEQAALPLHKRARKEFNSRNEPLKNVVPRCLERK